MYFHIFKSWDFEEGEGCFVVKSAKKLTRDEILTAMKNTLIHDYLSLFEQNGNKDNESFEEFFKKECTQDLENLKIGKFDDYYIQYLGSTEEESIQALELE